MSAYLCDLNHIAALAAESARRQCVIYAWRENLPSNPAIYAKNTARELAAANLASGTARYPDVSAEEWHGMTAEEYAAACETMAEKYYFRRPNLAPVDYLIMCAGFEYQACEIADWHASPAFLQLQWLRAELIRALPGADLAPWEYRGPAADKQRREHAARELANLAAYF